MHIKLVPVMCIVLWKYHDVVQEGLVTELRCGQNLAANQHDYLPTLLRMIGTYE